MSQIAQVKQDWRRGTGPRTAPDMARDLIQENGVLPALRIMNDVGAELYTDEKDLMGALQWLDTCIQFGMALSVGMKDPARKDVLSEVKAAAFHMGSYCWIGWGEPEIKISDSEKRLGLQMAMLNMSLAHELRKPDLVVGRAEWLMGALVMSFGIYPTAGAHFQRAAELLLRSGEDFEGQYNQALMACCTHIWEHKGRFVETDLDRVIEKHLQGEVDQFYTRQLRTAMHALKPTCAGAGRAAVAL